jgi:sugar lactone lactonase YvrE
MKVDVVVACADIVGEGPVWVPEESCLYWVDIGGCRLHRYDPATNMHRTVATPARVGSFALRRNGGMVAAMEHELGWLDPATGAFEAIAAPEADRPNNRYNDGRCDRQGRFHAGSMNLARDWPGGVLWRLDPSGRISEVASGVMVSNGLAWSPDGRTMHWADSPSGRIWRFAYDPDAGLAYDRKLWLEPADDAPGRPDGATVDAEGCYWSARWQGNRVLRFTPDGRIDREIRLPVSRITMCAFGGSDLRTLYITSAREGMSEAEAAAEPLAGALFAVDPGVQGLPEPRFAG